MSKYRTKPVIINAINWNGTPDLTYIKEWVESFGDDFSEHFRSGGAFEVQIVKSVFTRIRVGDYIIRGIEGKYYSCNSDFFKKYYKKVD